MIGRGGEETSTRQSKAAGATGVYKREKKWDEGGGESGHKRKDSEVRGQRANAERGTEETHQQEHTKAQHKHADQHRHTAKHSTDTEHSTDTQHSTAQTH